jgi:spermidine synthase
MDAGKKKLLVNGIQQSGPAVEGFWNFAFTHVPLPQKILSVLILGVGGGTVFSKIHARYPKASIIGVDIDSTIIDIATKHFGVSDIATLIVKDAKEYIRTCKKKYDLVIIDLYIGRDIPEFESSNEFVHEVQKNGNTVLINYLHDGEYGERSEKLIQLLKEEYANVVIADLPYNRFIYGSN